MSSAEAEHPAAPGAIWLAFAQASEVPSGTSWLYPLELQALEALRTEKRRLDWLLGRFAAKRVLAVARAARAPGAPGEDAAILASPGGAPRVLERGLPCGVTLSLSHSGGHAVAALALTPGELGCDLEQIEPREASFVETYFTLREQEEVRALRAEERACRVTAIWSAKEAALKALGEGLRRDTRDVEIRGLVGLAGTGPFGSPCHPSGGRTRAPLATASPDPAGSRWAPFTATVEPAGRRLYGRACVRGQELITLVTGERLSSWPVTER